MKELNEQNQVTRYFGFTNMALKNRISIFILTALLSLAGLYSYYTMPKEAFPEIVIPTIHVSTSYPGNSPADMENLVTRPIEKEIQSIDDVDVIESTSQQDYSAIVVEFTTDVEISAALREVKDAVDEAKSELPNDLPEDPTVSEINFSDMPIMTVNISGNFEHRTLKSYAEDLQDDFEQLNEISQANLSGDLEREILIKADLHKMESTSVSFQDIEDAVSSENITMSAGEIENKGFKRTMRITAEFDSAEEIKNIIVKEEDGQTVQLKDVATVIDGFEDRTSYSRTNRLPVISLQVIKRSGANLLAASDKIKTAIKEAKQGYLPDGIETSITNDNSRYTRNQVSNLENSIISGVILVTLTLLFFMGLRNALFVGLAIPLSMFIAFLLLDSSGVSLNLIVLFSLILALGLLVDNGIVVVENIYRLMQEGKSAMQAAKQGAGEVAIPIIASTATTLAAFFPLLFWGDITGEFMKYLPITLMIVLASSLFVAIVINPVFTSAFMTAETSESTTSQGRYLFYVAGLILLAVILYVINLNFLGGILLVLALITTLNIFILGPSSIWFQNRLLPKIESYYERLVRYALANKRPYFFFASTIVILIGSILLLYYKAPKVLFFPENEPNNVFVYTEMPIGTNLERTDSITRKVAEQVYNVIEPYRDIVESVKTNVGKGAQNPQESFTTGGQATPNKSRITVAFVDNDERNGILTSNILEKIRNAVGGIPGPTITVEKDEMGPPVGRPINLEISGENINKLVKVTNDIKETVEAENIDGIEELKTDLETQKPQLVVDVDRNRAQRFGLSTNQVANELRTGLFGKEISKFKAGEDEFDIRLRLEDEYRYNVSNLLNQKITVRKDGAVKQIPISSVANINYGTTYGSIQRKDLERVITIYSNVEEGGNANQIVNRMKTILADYNMPDGFEYKFTGEQEEQAKSSGFLLRALMIAVFTIFLILVTQFNSIIKPFIIIGSVIFSTIGVFLGLVIFQMDFVVVMTGIGIISLAGIVVNNAIVLIDYIDLVRERRKQALGLSEEDHLSSNEFLQAVVEGGKIRLRPVLLTALTTILGLIPLATGLNINFYTLLTQFDPQIYFGGNNALFWGPMAWTVVFGLTFATFLTLVIVPVMYVISDRIMQKFLKR